MAARTRIDDQDRTVLTGLKLPWYKPADSDFVRVPFGYSIPPLLTYLKVKGYRQMDAEESAAKKRAADMIVSVTLEEGDSLRRNSQKSYVEIRHPELNAFIQQELLRLTPPSLTR